MPPLPKECDYKRLIALLNRYEYKVVRQKGSHISLHSEKYAHSITVPAHTPLKIGTLNSIINDVASRTGEKKQNLVEKL